MARLVGAALSADIIIEAQSNAPTLVRLIQGLRTPVLPVPGVAFRVYSLWRKEGEGVQTIRVRAVLERPDETRMDDAVISEDLTSDLPNHRWMFTPAAWMLDVHGCWHVVLEMHANDEWQEVARLPLDVQPQPTPE